MPNAAGMKPTITVDNETNQVTFSLADAAGMIPVWNFQDKNGEWTVWQAQQGFKKIYTTAGDYTVRIELMSFPDQVPAAGVTRLLNDRMGNPLDTCNGLMHVLNCDWQGGTRICHYGPRSWTPNVSLYKVFIKCRLWLELYELHLQTGKPIDHFVVHQQ